MKSKSVSSATKQGRRDYQEDCYVCCVLRQGVILAVMDGHGGDIVAKTAAAFLEQDFLGAYSPQKAEESVLEEVVHALRARTDQCDGVGSTLSIAWVRPRGRRVIAAVIGDSPVMVVDAAGKIHLSPEHNIGTNSAERQAALDRGGVLIGNYLCNPRGDGVQLTRALGDAEFGRILCREPEIYCVENPRKVVVATDGLFAPAHLGGNLTPPMEQAVREAKGAEDLMNWAEKRGLSDNITVLHWAPSR